LGRLDVITQGKILGRSLLSLFQRGIVEEVEHKRMEAKEVVEEDGGKKV